MKRKMRSRKQEALEEMNALYEAEKDMTAAPSTLAVGIEEESDTAERHVVNIKGVSVMIIRDREGYYHMWTDGLRGGQAKEAFDTILKALQSVQTE